MECMIMTQKMEDLQKDIQNMEKELAEAKKMADEAVKEEMKALGYSQDSYEFNPFTGWRRLL